MPKSPRVRRAGPSVTALPLRAGSALEVVEFDDFPSLAVWCRSRVPIADQPQFVIGSGQAYRALLEFVASCPDTDVLLMAIRQRSPCPHGGSPLESLEFVFACQRQPVVPATRASSATALLYQRGAAAAPSPDAAAEAEAEAATTL